jgi:hypothetical protein
MSNQALERRFAAIGARVRVVSASRSADARIDVAWDRRGEVFELTLPSGVASADVLDTDALERCLLLLVRDGGEKSKFLCGFDERHWFVAAVPEDAAGVGGVEAAKEALQPEAVREAVARKRPRDRFQRRNVAYVRQGESFFLPEWTFHVEEQDVLRDEPLTRGHGKDHVLELAFRRGGETVYVNDLHPGGLTEDEFDRLSPAERRGEWRELVRDPELYAKGAVRHPDHNTIVLPFWHRVLMNTEQRARAMRHVAFLD